MFPTASTGRDQAVPDGHGPEEPSTGELRAGSCRYGRGVDLSSELMITGITLLVAVLVGLIGLVIAVLAGRYPNRSKRHPQRVRMPRIVLVLGLLVIAIGLWFGLTAGEARYPPGMRIASILLIVGGLVALVAYACWYVEPGPDAIRSRTVFGRTRSVVYAEISSYRFSVLNGQRFVSVASVNGDLLSLSTTKYDVSSLLAAIEFREARGRWPLSGEVVQGPDPRPGVPH